MKKPQHLSKTMGRSLAGALALLGAAAMAAPEKGLYIGADLGRSRADLSSDAKPSPAMKRSATSLGLHAGYQFNPYLAAELGVTRLGSASIGDSSAKARAYSLDALAKMPLNDKFSLYGRLGAAHYERSFKGGAAPGGQHAVGLHVGLGMDYALSPTWGVRTELSRYNNLPVADGYGRSADHWSLGVNYKF